MVRAKTPITGVCSTITTRPARVRRSASRGSVDVQGSIVSKRIWLFENEDFQNASSCEDLSDTSVAYGAPGCFKHCHKWWLTTNLLPSQLCTKCNKRVGTKKAVHKCTVCKSVFHLKCSAQHDELALKEKTVKTEMDMTHFVTTDVRSSARQPCQVPKTKKPGPFSRMPRRETRQATKQTAEINNNVNSKWQEEEIIIEESEQIVTADDTQCSNKSQTKQKLAGMKSSFVKRCQSLKKKVKCIKDKAGTGESSLPKVNHEIEKCDDVTDNAEDLQERAEAERAAMATSPILNRVKSRQAEIRAEITRRRVGPYKKENRGKRKIVFDTDLNDIRDRLDVVEKQLNTLTKEVPTEIKEWRKLGMKFRNDSRRINISQDEERNLSHETHPKELEANGYPSVSSTSTADHVYVIGDTSSSSNEHGVDMAKLEAEIIPASHDTTGSDGGHNDSSLLPSGIPNRLKLDIKRASSQYSDHQTSTPVTNCELSFRSASKEYAKMHTITHKNVTMINTNSSSNDSSCKLKGGSPKFVRDSENRSGENSMESSQQHKVSPTQRKVLSPEQIAVKNFLAKRKSSSGSFTQSPTRRFNLSGSPPIASSTFRNGEALDQSVLQSDMSPVSYTLRFDVTDGSQYSFAKVANESKLHDSRQLNGDPISPVYSELSYTFRNDSQMMPEHNDENLPGYTTNGFVVGTHDGYTESESEAENHKNGNRIEVQADIEMDGQMEHARTVRQDPDCAASIDGTSFTTVTEFSADEINSFCDKKDENYKSRWINKDVFMFGGKGSIRCKQGEQQCLRVEHTRNGYVDETGDGRKPPIPGKVSSADTNVDFLKQAEKHLELYQSRRKHQLAAGDRLEKNSKPPSQQALNVSPDEESEVAVKKEEIIPVEAKTKVECYKTNETHEFEEMEKQLRNESIASKLGMSKSLTDIASSVSPGKGGTYGRSVSCTSSIDGETKSIINESARYHFLHEKGMIKISSPGLKLVTDTPGSRRDREFNDIEEEDSTDLAESGSETDTNDLVIDNHFSLVRTREMCSSHSETSEQVSQFTETCHDIIRQQSIREAKLLEDCMKMADSSQDSWDNVLNWMKRDYAEDGDEELQEELKMMSQQEEAGPSSDSLLEDSVYYSFQGQSEELRTVLSPCLENAEAEHSHHDGTEELWNLMALVQHGTAEQVEQLLSSDRTISESEIKEAVGWSLEQRLYEKSWLLLQDVCRLLVAAEGDNCVEAFPAYRDHCWEPLFVVLSKLNYQGEWDSFMGFNVYKRRYDFVSPEAALVINSDLVQNNPLTLDDIHRAKHAINSAGLQERHSKITLINACPYRSKNMGEVLEKGMCIVVHCWLKRFIPFNEEPFPEEIEGIPVDVREAYFQVGGKTLLSPERTKRPKPSSTTSSMSDMTGSPGSQSEQSSCLTGSKSNASSRAVTPSCSTASLNSEEDMGSRTMVSHEVTDMEGDVVMGPEGDCIFPHSNLDKFQAMDLDNSLELHIGTKSKDFNKSLRIGTCIGPSGGEGSGTLGGFVRLKNGGIGALTCAHVTQNRKLMSQPAEAELENASLSRRCVFGQVCEQIFQQGSVDEAGVDFATIIVMDRHPENAQFIWARKEQITFAGFDLKSPPRFTKGNILGHQDLTPRKRHTSVIKAGAETGLTCGKLYLDGLYARTSNREMRLPNSNQTIEFFNQMEIVSVQGTGTRFFDLGDSGSLVFMPLNGSELYCIGMCVGCTSYSSCIVTPIEDIFNKSDMAVKFIDFSQL